MTTGRFLDNPYYTEYVRLLKELHLLMVAGKADSEEAEAIRDAMDEPWYNLSPEEMTRVGIMSAGLSMMEGKEKYRQVLPIERSREWLGPRLGDAWKSQDWDTFLTLLRNGPDFIPSDVIAYFRARAYAELGHPDIALLFYDYAAKRKPENFNYPALAMQSLIQAGRLGEAVERANKLINDKNTHPYQLFMPAEVLYKSTETMSKEDARSVFKRIISILQTALKKESRLSNAERIKPLVAEAYQMIAICYDNLGQTKEAIENLDHVLELRPEDKDILEIRRLLELRENGKQPRSHSEQAVQENSSPAMPHYDLASVQDETASRTLQAA